MVTTKFFGAYGASSTMRLLESDLQHDMRAASNAYPARFFMAWQVTIVPFMSERRVSRVKTYKEIARK